MIPDRLDQRAQPEGLEGLALPLGAADVRFKRSKKTVVPVAGQDPPYFIFFAYSWTRKLATSLGRVPGPKPAS